MRKIKKQTLSQLVLENKQELLKDEKALEQIESRLEDRITSQAEKIV